MTWEYSVQECTADTNFLQKMLDINGLTGFELVAVLPFRQEWGNEPEDGGGSGAIDMYRLVFKRNATAR